MTRMLPALLVLLALAAPVAAADDLSLSADARGAVSVDWKDAELTDAIRLLARVGQVNTVVDAKARGKTITLVLNDVPWRQALDAACSLSGFSAVLEGNVLRVAPTAALAAEAEQVARLAEAEAEAAPLTTVAVPLSWVDARDVEDMVLNQLTPRGSTMIDPRTNTLFITDDFDGVVLDEGLTAVSVPGRDARVTVIARLFGAPGTSVLDARPAAFAPPADRVPAAAWRILLAEGDPAELPGVGISVELARNGTGKALVVRAGRVGAHVPADRPGAVVLQGPGGEAVLTLEPVASSD